jgi:hypothetical protein
MRGQIDLNRPLTEDEKKFLRTRAGGESLITVNERQFADASADEKSALQTQAQIDAEEDAARQAALQDPDDEDDFDPEDVAKVAPLKLAELRAWLKKAGLPQQGTMEELQVRILEKMESDRLGGVVSE